MSICPLNNARVFQIGHLHEYMSTKSMLGCSRLWLHLLFLENLGDPIKIRVNVVRPAPVTAVAFPTATVVRTLARHGEVIRGIQERLLEMPTQRWEEIEEELMALRDRERQRE
ncbi:hypothetical protein Tco_0700993 [Tanacetum coccineum]